VARVGAVGAALVGVLCLIGYALGIRQLVGWVPSESPMAPSTGLVLVVVATGVWLLAAPPGSSDGGRHRSAHRLGRVIGALVASYGIVLLSGYLTGNEVFGRPAPSGGLLFLVLGLTLALLDVDERGGFRPARTLAPVGGLIAVVALLGSVFGLTHPPGVAAVPGLPPHTAAALLLLAVAIPVGRPDRPGVRWFTGTDLGAVTVRRIAPAVLAVFVALAAVLAAVGTSDLQMRGLRVTIAMTALLVMAYFALLHTATILDRAARRQAQLAGELRDHQDFSETVLESLFDGVVALDPDGVVLRVTPRWSEITGYPADGVVGCGPPYPWWPPEQMEQRAAAINEIVSATSRLEFATDIIRADGARINVLATTSPICTADGRVRMVIVTVRDLSEHNQAEAERLRLADQLDHLFAMSHDLMCVAGTDGYLQRVNPAWEQLLGYTTAELLGRPYLDFVHPDDVAHTEVVALALAERRLTTVAMETRLRTSDGADRWINWSATLAPDDAIYAVGRDVTEKRRASDAAAWLAAIVESTDDAIIGKSREGRITSWNAAAQRIYGYRSDEVVGRSVDVIIPPNERARHSGIMARTIGGEVATDHDAVRIRKDGTEIHVDLSISPVRDADGVVVGGASISRDITSRRRVDERFRRLVVNAPVAMVMVGADGVIRLVNDQTQRLFGYDSAELIGRPIEMLVPHQLRDTHATYRRDYLAAPVIRSMGAGQELYGQRRDGTQFPVEIGLAPLETEEGMLVSAVIHDITERKQVQQALAAARDDAIAAAKLRSQFVAMVSHEIRTPMNGVIGLTRLLLETPLAAGQRRYSEAIQTSARALLTIINDILDFSKIEAGKVSLVAADLHLGALVEEVVNAGAEAARDKELEVLAYYPAGLPATVLGDEGRIRQVLLNLVGNAVKFTERGEVVLRVDKAAAPDSYTFTVTDTGIGIAPADIARLFDAFIQADTTTSRQFGGTGLGLTISRQLVELMGGRLDVDSVPGRGSRFWFTLPLTAQSPHRPLAGNRLAGKRVLIVDDTRTSREMLAEHTESWGMTAVTASDVEAAMARLIHTGDPDDGFDIVVLDEDLSGADRLVGRIRVDPAARQPYIVLLSSGHKGAEPPAGRGPDHLLPKPVGPSALYNCLIELFDLEGGRAARAFEAPVATASPAPDRGLVLLAEDNDINQMVAMDTLAMLGYRADLARNGVEAVTMATTRSYQVILMDCQMPTMDGFEATRELRRRETPDHHVPVIALTAGALTEDRQRCLDAGMDDYLAKPLDPDDLRAALERWTSHDGLARHG
jgi:PAS domain S-box-containing protein